MLATLNFRIIELAADGRTVVIPGYGRISRLQTSDNRASSLMRWSREGARIGRRFVVSRDCDLLIDAVDAEEATSPAVFLMITWYNPDIEATVVAL